MASLTYHVSKLIVLFLVLYFRSMKCTLQVHDTATNNIDEIFDDISEDLSETRLRHLLHKTDINQDGLVSSDELKTWVRNMRQSHAVKMTKERMAEYDSNDDGVVSKNEYFDLIYGNIEKIDSPQETHDMLAKSKNEANIRWKYADFNQDGNLSLEECAALENPEDYEEMKDYNVEATFQSLDADNDGKVSLNEYLGSDASTNVAADEVDFRVRYFKLLKDRDQDGYLDMAEVKKWLYRSYPSRIEIETNGFMQQMDGNKDGILNQNEILNNWDKFNKKYPDLQSILLEHDEL